MVASPIGQRAKALAILVLLVMSSLSLLVSPAAAQPDTPGTPQAPEGPDTLRISLGDVNLSKTGTNRPTKFVEPGTAVDVAFSARNYATTPQTGIFIWVWLEESPAGFDGRCFRVDFPRSNQGQPGYVNRTATFILPDDLADEVDKGHNFTVSVDTPPTGSGAAAARTYTRGDGSTCSAADRSTQPKGVLDNPATNVAYAYFVVSDRVNFQVRSIRWCESAGGESEVESDPTTCRDVGPNYGFTRQSGSSDRLSHFVVDVVNNGSWQDVVDYSGATCKSRTERNFATCPRFAYTVNITVTAPNGTKEYLTPSRGYNNSTEQRAGDKITSDWWKSRSFDLANKAGNYTVDARIIWNDDGWTGDNTGSGTAYVRYMDLIAEPGTGWKSDPDDPYPYQTNTRIRGNITLRNVGEQATAGFAWRAYLNDGSRPDFTSGASAEPLDGSDAVSVHINWQFSTIQAQGVDNYLAPGQHMVTVEVDTGGAVFEFNETNNTLRFPIYIEDIKAPEFNRTAPIVVKNEPNGSYSELVGGVVRPHESIDIIFYATDADQASVQVVANFTSASNASFTFERALEQVSFRPTEYYLVIDDLPMPGNESTDTWNVRFRAKDAFGNENLSQPYPLAMRHWELHSVDEATLSPNVVDGASFNWSRGPDANAPIDYELWLFPETTGIHDQHTNSSNFELRVEAPNGYRHVHRGIPPWTPSDCFELPDPQENGITKFTTDLTPEEEEACESLGRWRTGIDKGSGSPGKWNISFNISDISGMNRTFNRTLIILDQPPEFIQGSLEFSSFAVNATENVTVTLRVADDYRSDEVRVFANWTRKSDGAYANFSMGPGSVDDGLSARLQRNFTTGRGAMLGLAGAYNVTFHAVDAAGNWNRTRGIDFEIGDALPPRIISAGVTPTLQEIETDVTFFANVHDETNVTVELRVRTRGSSEVVLGPVLLTPGPDGNYTYTTNFTNPGDFEWAISVTDSVPLSAEPASGLLTIRRNLGPRFEVRSPASIIDGAMYGTAAPRIEVLVYDNDGIDIDSLSMLINDQPVAFDRSNGPAGLGGYVLVHQVAKADAYLHGATVKVNLTAAELSDELLANNHSFSFQVDAVEPIVRAKDYAPKFAASDAGVYNVSLETRFTLEAHDDDGLPTRVTTIWYSVSSVSQVSAQKVYDGPFRLGEVEGLQPRPGRYTINFFAEDSVGNVNKQITTLPIDLDSSPPYANPYGAKPRGRDIAFTLLDDGAGVDRAVVWHRINNGTYELTAMVPDGDVWRAALPEGRKGDRISYYVQTWDRVENSATFGTAEEPYDQYVVPNHPPTLRIKTPLQGDVLSRQVNVEWESNDLDGEALTFTVSLKSPGGGAFSELTRIEQLGRRTYAFDTTKFGDGDYTLRVEVTDGTATNRSDVSFSIRNKAGAIGTISSAKASVLPGEATLVTAEITKADPISVEAHVYRDDAFIASYAMRDDGEEGDERAKDGIWSTLVVMDAAGDYRVSILTKYREDGVEKNATREDGARFSVALTPGYIMVEYAPLIALVALSAAVAIGVAGYIAFRRRL